MAKEMKEQDTEPDIRALSMINLVLGAWLIVTPFWFSYTSGTARWNQVVIGVVVVVLAGVRTLLPHARWISVLTGLAGLWAIIAPFILGYNHVIAYWNEIIVGLIVTYLAFYNTSLPTEGQTSHHHTPYS